jgi:hypothetical protein
MNWRRFGVNLGKPIYNLGNSILPVPKLIEKVGEVKGGLPEVFEYNRRG